MTTVKSTQEAIDAITQMQTIIGGGLLEALTSLKVQGDILNPANWDGPKAATFYENWPTTKTALDTLITELGELGTTIMTVNTDIQAAGGNM